MINLFLDFLQAEIGFAVPFNPSFLLTLNLLNIIYKFMNE